MEVVLVGGLADGKRVTVIDGLSHINVAVPRNPMPVLAQNAAENFNERTWEGASYSSLGFVGADGKSTVNIWVSDLITDVQAIRLLLSRHPPTSTDGDYETKNRILRDMARLTQGDLKEVLDMAKCYMR